MYCTECGEQYTDDSNFCNKCGMALTQFALNQPMQELQRSDVTQEVNRKRTSGMALASLIIGITGLLIFPLGILAIIFGVVALRWTGKNPNLEGREIAVAGLVMGIITFPLWIGLCIAFYLLFAWPVLFQVF